MPSPSGSFSLIGGQPSRPAYLIRFPEDVWGHIENAFKTGGGLTVSTDGGMSLNIPNHPSLILDQRTAGTPSEIHLQTSSSLQPIGTATTRLTIPISSSSSSQAAQKLKSQNEAIDREKKERAERVSTGKKDTTIVTLASTGMGRTQSSPQFGSGSTPGSPMIPLKTRVVQLLALGPISVTDIVKRVGGAEQDIMRVVNVVGQEISHAPYPTFSLSPAQYSKVKIASWKYTHSEQHAVVQLAREAFDSMGLPPDAEERLELDRKEQEIGASLSGEETSVLNTPSKVEHTIPTIVTTESPLRHSHTVDKPRKPSPSPVRDKGKLPKQTAKQIATSKQIAKFKLEANKRSSSLPVRQKQDSPSSSHSELPIKEDRQRQGSVVKGKRKREEPEKKKRMASPTFTSSDESDEPEKERGRPTKRKTSFDGKSNGTSVPSPKINGHADLPLTAPIKDPEMLRDRYEELFPAYQQLTRKLVELHQVASTVKVGEDEDDGEEEGEVVSLSMGIKQEDVEKMVKKWNRWHTELEDIRRWFGEGE